MKDKAMKARTRGDHVSSPESAFPMQVSDEKSMTSVRVDLSSEHIEDGVVTGKPYSFPEPIAPSSLEQTQKKDSHR